MSEGPGASGRTKEKKSTGIPGLDDVLAGGLTEGRLFLLEGSPGTGKTTVAMQFLLAGAARGESGLYITLSETAEELRESAAAHGWTLPPEIEVFELTPPESLLDADQQQSLLYSSDLELGETARAIFRVVERARPARVIIDSLSEIRLLAQNSLRYRRQILALKHYLARTGATVLMLDDLTAEAPDRTVHSIAHGVIRLEELSPEYGADRRRLRTVKYRGNRYRGGFHDFTIVTGGVRVFPRLVSAEHRQPVDRRMLSSGNAALDGLVGGGIERGSSTLIIGPAGTGKTLLGLTFLASAVARGERAAMFVFDEEMGLLLGRAAGMGVDLRGMIDAGKLAMEQIDAAELTPGEFSERVRKHALERGTRSFLIDSLNGYRAAMPGEQSLLLHMHELLQFLNRGGASTFLTIAQHGLVGDMNAPIDITYLADTVILLRYFEAAGRVRRAISVVKKRTGSHETTIREYQIRDIGLEFGEPLVNFQGVLRGVPELVGAEPTLLDERAK